MSFRKFTPPKRATSAERARMPMLYVEDEDMSWELAERALRDRYQLHRARNAREAFELLRRVDFSVILMDIQLSGSDMSGIEIVQALRGTFNGLVPDYARGMRSTAPVAFVTAYGARYDKDYLVKVGGDDLATKPLNMASLALVLARLSVSRLKHA